MPVSQRSTSVALRSMYVATSGCGRTWNFSARMASMHACATSAGDSTPSALATPEPPLFRPSPSGLFWMMFVSTACGHSTETRIP